MSLEMKLTATVETSKVEEATPRGPLLGCLWIFTGIIKLMNEQPGTPRAPLELQIPRVAAVGVVVLG